MKLGNDLKKIPIRKSKELEFYKIFNNRANLIIRNAILVAKSDGQVSDDEEAIIVKLIDSLGFDCQDWEIRKVWFIFKICVYINEKTIVGDMLDAFDKQVESLKQRTGQVEKVINMKNNPKMLLERLARDVPEDVWFETLKISADSKITINGSSSSYKSIGTFITSSNDAAFFGKTLGLISSDTKSIKLDGQQVRIENFKVEGKVLDYGRF